MLSKRYYAQLEAKCTYHKQNPANIFAGFKFAICNISSVSIMMLALVTFYYQA